MLILPFTVKIEIKPMEKGRNSLHNHQASMTLQAGENYEIRTYDSEESDDRRRNIVRNNKNRNERKGLYGRNRNESHNQGFNEFDSQITKGKGLNREEHKEHQKYFLEGKEIEVKGYMTIKEISNKYKISNDYLKKKLDIPLSTSDNERLGTLRRIYGFQMHQIEKIIQEYYRLGKNHD